MSHTKGPWAIAPKTAQYIATSDNPAIKQWLELSGKDRFDALSVGTVDGSVAIIPLDESNVDNAQLIAVAPEMLAELRNVLEWTRIEKIPLRAQEIASIERVIAKATGA